MSTTYLVEIDLQTKGDFGGAKVGELSGKVGGLKRGISEMRDGLSGASDIFTGLVEKAGSLAMHLAAGGTVAAVGLMTYGVIGLNHELENTQISLAAIFSAQGVTASVPEGMKVASTVMEQMRKDAAALPGEFDDLKKIFTTIATPALATGMGVNNLRKMASETMAVGAVMGIRSDQTAREMAMLLEGRAGGHNVLGMRLGFMGDKAHELKMADSQKRVAMINEELTKYAPAIDEFQKSYEGISTTTISNVKMLLAHATSPLFESVKETLQHINEWYDRNASQLDHFAKRLGDNIAAAWHRGVEIAEEWGPKIGNFVETAYTRMVSFWESIQPHVQTFANFMRKALDDPNGTLDKLKGILELYAALKVGGSVVGAVGSAVQVGAGAVTLGKGLGLLGGAGGAAAGAGGAEVGALGAAGGTAAFVGGSTAALVGAAAGAVVGVTATVYELTKLVQDIRYHAAGGVGERDEDMEANKRAQYEAGMRSAQSITTSANAYDEATRMIHHLANAGFEAEASALSLSLSMRDAADAADRMRDGMMDIRNEFGTELVSTLKAVGEKSNVDLSGIFGSDMANKKKLEHPGGKGVNINKIEIVVTGTGDPGRVARLVRDEVADLRRHPKISNNVRNWSVARQ